MLLVQKYLENNSLGNLARDHGVYASFSKSGHKFSLNYDQIEAKESDPLAQECRGLILSLEDGRSIFGQIDSNGKMNRDSIEPGVTRVLAYPMKRFFNHGQGAAANIDWSDPNLAILEKLDGTLCIVYYDPFTEKWCVATRSVPEADLFMDNGVFTFRTLFEKAVQDTLGYSFDQLSEKLNTQFTYCFELTTPYNRIVVNYPHNRMTLLAARNLDTLQEVNPRELQLDVPVVEAHTYTTINELLDWVSSLDPSKHEGVVVKDHQFNRIKVKSLAYVAANKLRDTLGTSPRNCLELILLGKEDDAVSLLPEEITKNLISMKEKYKEWLISEELSYFKVKAEALAIDSNKKTFAITLNQYPKLFKSAYFSIFDGQTDNIKDFIAKQKKEGSWSNSFLDKILSYIEYE